MACNIGDTNLGLFSIDIRCTNCDHTWDDLVDRELADTAIHVCPNCNFLAGRRTMSKPNVTKASYVDGTKRFKDLKEGAKLKQIKRDQRDQADKKRISNEIKKLKVKEY